MCLGLAYVDAKNGKKMPTCGDLLHVKGETCGMPQGERRRTTCNLREMSVEAAHVAVSWVRHHQRTLVAWLGGECLEKTDGIHVHLDHYMEETQGTVGAAFVVVTVGYTTKHRIRQDMAITGEVSLTGVMQSVMGIPEKLEAARQGRLTKVLVPVVNKERWNASYQPAKHTLHPVLRDYGDTVIQPTNHITDALEFVLDGEFFYLIGIESIALSI